MRKLADLSQLTLAQEILAEIAARGVVTAQDLAKSVGKPRSIVSSCCRYLCGLAGRKYVEHPVLERVEGFGPRGGYGYRMRVVSPT